MPCPLQHSRAAARPAPKRRPGHLGMPICLLDVGAARVCCVMLCDSLRRSGRARGRAGEGRPPGNTTNSGNSDGGGSVAGGIPWQPAASAGFRIKGASRPGTVVEGVRVSSRHASHMHTTCKHMEHPRAAGSAHVTGETGGIG